jgi:hypothetical protein
MAIAKKAGVLSQNGLRLRRRPSTFAQQTLDDGDSESGVDEVVKPQSPRHASSDQAPLLPTSTTTAYLQQHDSRTPSTLTVAMIYVNILVGALLFVVGTSFALADLFVRETDKQ